MIQALPPTLASKTTIVKLNPQLIRKYNQQGPRYTSYPTVPYWDKEPPSAATWQDHVRRTFAATNATEGLSLYIHLPYCESLCTYCGCNKRITVNHAVEGPYIDALLAEWAMYRATFAERPRIREIHLGGGTPTFFHPDQLQRLIEGLLENAEVHPNHAFSFEGHPNNTTRAHLQRLYDLGFRRVSFGIQDFDPKVQKVINRIQPLEKVVEVTEAARAIGYTSVNYDLIYGLPLQKRQNIIRTFRQVEKLRPDRIAYYSYAHVPWKSAGQRAYSEADLPVAEEKRQLYIIGAEMMMEMGYKAIGMDHFALPEDPLYRALKQGNMHRNFMGYTEHDTRLLIGLGVSAISDCGTAFAQNKKVVEAYMDDIAQGEMAIFKGHLLTETDRILRAHITNLMCRYETSWAQPDMQCPELFEGLQRMAGMEAEQLLKIENGGIKVSTAGKPFIRNVCMHLDARLAANRPTANTFSATV